MVSSVIDVTTASFPSAVIERSHQLPVVVDLWAEWCGPCKTLGPVLERAAADGGGRWILAKVDVDANPELARTLGVQGIPTVVAFVEGQEVDRFTGAIPEQQVRAFVDGLLPSALDVATTRADALLDRGDAAGAREGYRAVLSEDPTHEDAGLSLAGLLVEDDRHEEALEVLARLAPTEAVRRMQAFVRLGADHDGPDPAVSQDDGTPAARLARARALAASDAPRSAIGPLMEVLGERIEPESDRAREILLDVFALLGTDDPLVVETRRRLANGLY